jgi:uncharacterized membrane protein
MNYSRQETAMDPTGHDQQGTVMTDPVVEDYLYRLDAAARVLPDDRRRELVDEIAAHIAQARTGGTGAPGGQGDGGAGMRTVLERLGDPGEIVAAARAEEGHDPAPGPRLSPDGRNVLELRPPRTTLEIAAALMLTVGSIVPVVGWVVGVVLLWMSRRWRTWEKVLATLVVPGGPGLALVAGATGFGGGSSSCTSFSSGVGSDATSGTAETCTHTGLPVVVGALLFGVWVLAPIVVAIVLLVRARNRAAAEPPVEHWRSLAERSRWGPLEIVGLALLTVGAFILPVVGPVAGLACAWGSRAWTAGEKTVATVVAAVPAVAWLAVLSPVSFAPDLVAGWVALAAFALSALAPAAAGILLAVRLNARRTRST